MNQKRIKQHNIKTRIGSDTMELTQDELQLMVHHLTQQVAQLTADKSMLMAKLELATVQLNQAQGQE